MRVSSDPTDPGYLPCFDFSRLQVKLDGEPVPAWRTADTIGYVKLYATDPDSGAYIIDSERNYVFEEVRGRVSILME